MAATFPDFDTIRRRVADALSGAWSVVVSPPRDPAADRDIAEKAAVSAPVVWLIGKVQSGKSSIVRALTGATAAEVGSGFRACTKTARIFDFPAEAPVIRFLDTRGLGEAGYDAAADIAVAEGQAHLLLVVMRATDPAQDAIVEVVRQARRKHPDWPVLVAHTSLHDAYPAGQGHAEPYPFDGEGRPLPGVALPGDLARSIAYQRGLFTVLPGRGPVAFTAIDFTQPEDGFEPRLYGLDALNAALLRVAPQAISSALAAGSADDAVAQRAHSHIVGYATAAAAADVVPVAGAVAVPGIQGKMLHSLGEIYGVTWDRRMIGELSGALGAGVLLRVLSGFGARQIAKLVPVYGQTAGAAAAAAMSFATTYALGKAAGAYLERKRAGVEGVEGVLATYEAALRGAFDIAKARILGGAKDDGAKDDGAGSSAPPAGGPKA